MDPSSSRSTPPAKAATTSDFLSDLSFQLQQEEEELLQMEASLLSPTKDPKIEASAWRPVTIAGISTTKQQPASPDTNHKQISDTTATTTKPPAASPVPSPTDELAMLKAELEKQRRQLLDLQQLKTKTSSPPAAAAASLDLNATPSPPETPARCRLFPDISGVYTLDSLQACRVCAMYRVPCVVSCRRTNTASRTTSWPRSTGSRRRCSATWKK